MPDELDQLALDNMVRSLQAAPATPLPQPDPRYQADLTTIPKPAVGMPSLTPMPQPDPRGATFRDRIPSGPPGNNTMDIQVPPASLLGRQGITPDADRAAVLDPDIVGGKLGYPGSYLPPSYGAGIHKIYTSTMPRMQPPNIPPMGQDKIGELLKALEGQSRQ